MTRKKGSTQSAPDKHELGIILLCTNCTYHLVVCEIFFYIYIYLKHWRGLHRAGNVTRLQNIGHIYVYLIQLSRKVNNRYFLFLHHNANEKYVIHTLRRWCQVTVECQIQKYNTHNGYIWLILSDLTT